MNDWTSICNDKVAFSRKPTTDKMRMCVRIFFFFFSLLHSFILLNKRRNRKPTFAHAYTYIRQPRSFLEWWAKEHKRMNENDVKSRHCHNSQLTTIHWKHYLSFHFTTMPHSRCTVRKMRFVSGRHVCCCATVLNVNATSFVWLPLLQLHIVRTDYNIFDISAFAHTIAELHWTWTYIYLDSTIEKKKERNKEKNIFIKVKSCW